MALSRSIRSYSGRVLIAGGALVATLLALELLLQALTLLPAVDRYLFPVMVGWRSSDYEALFYYDERFGKYMLRTAQGFRHVHDGGEYDYEINTVPCGGLAVRPPCHLGPDTSFHFGDSFTFGFGVTEDQTFVSLLDQSGPGHHVNFGVPGDDLLAEIDEARMLLADLPEEEHPRALYFHAFFGNDIREAWKYLARAGELGLEGPREPSRVARLVKQSKLRQLVKNRLKSLRFRGIEGRPVPKGFTFVPKHLAAIETMDPESLAILDRVAAACATRMGELRRSYGGDIVVTLIPPKEIYFLADDMAPYERRRAVFRAAFRPYGVIVIDMLETVAPSEILPLFFKMDTHFNRDGHRRFARILRSHPPLSGLASAAQLDTPPGRP